MEQILHRIQRSARRHPACAVVLLQRLQAAAHAAGQHAVALDALFQRYFVLERMGEAAGLIDELYAGLQIAEDLNLPRQAGQMLEAIGRVRYTHGEYGEAMHCWGRCVDMFGVTGDVRSGVEARIGLGAMYNAFGDSQAGSRFHRDARALLAGIDDPYLSAKLALNLGVNERSDGQLDSAIVQFELGLAEAQRGQVREYVAEAYWHLGQCALDQSDLERAANLTRTALELGQACNYLWLNGAALDSVAKIALLQGRDDEARAAYEAGLRFAKRIGSRAQQANCHGALSRLAEQHGDMDSALRHARAHMAIELEVNAELSAPDRLRTMQQYDLSEKPPIQKLLELASSGSTAGAEWLAALRRIAAAALDILRIDFVAVWLRDGAGGEPECCVMLGPPGLAFAVGRRLTVVAQPIYGELQRALREASVVHDTRLHPARSELDLLFGVAHIRSLLELPLRLRGENVGVLSFGQSAKRRNWTRDDVLFGSHLANQVEHVLGDSQHLEIQEKLARSNRELEQRVQERTAELEHALLALEESSLTDPLTGLRNRRFLLRHLDNDAALTVRRSESQRLGRGGRLPDTDLVLFMVDLDHFKQVNDSLGHQAGDAVLVQIKQRLLRVFRESDYLVRWGGEEFLIVARATARSQAPMLAERGRKTIADEAFMLDDGTRLEKTCSVGFAGYPFIVTEPRALSWQEVVALIDMAMYAAKRAGRNGWVGVGATGRTDAAGLMARFKAAPAAAVRSGHIELTTSLDYERVVDAL